MNTTTHLEQPDELVMTAEQEMLALRAPIHYRDPQVGTSASAALVLSRSGHGTHTAVVPTSRRCGTQAGTRGPRPATSSRPASPARSLRCAPARQQQLPTAGSQPDQSARKVPLTRHDAPAPLVSVGVNHWRDPVRRPASDVVRTPGFERPFVFPGGRKVPLTCGDAVSGVR